MGARHEISEGDYAELRERALRVVPPPPPSEATIETARGMREWAKGSRKPKKRSPGAPKPSEARRKKVRAEAMEIFTAARWALVRPEHFVEMYAVLHEKVYGVPAAEMTTSDWTLAHMAARRMMQKSFAGDAAEMSSFFRWVWKAQERDEVKRRAGNKDDDFRVTWRYQFSEKLWTQWRIAVNRGRT